MTLAVFPTNSWFNVDINPSHVIAMTRSRGNHHSEIRSADPTWMGSLVTTELSTQQLAAWEAFISECSDRLRIVEWTHPLFPCPMSYTRAEFSALSWAGTVGVGDVTAVTDLRTLEVSGLPSGMTLLPGDRVSVTEGGYVSYRMVAEAVTAGALTTTLKLTPRLPLGIFTSAAEVKLLDPPVRMRVAPNSWAALLVGGEAPKGSFDVYEASHADV